MISDNVVCKLELAIIYMQQVMSISYSESASALDESPGNHEVFYQYAYCYY